MKQAQEFSIQYGHFGCASSLLRDELVENFVYEAKNSKQSD